MAFDFLSQSLADVPMGDIVFDKMGNDDKGNGEGWIGHLDGDEGTGGAVSDRKHSFV